MQKSIRQTNGGQELWNGALRMCKQQKRHYFKPEDSPLNEIF